MVSARRLTYRKVRFLDRKPIEATLFPIFDRDGLVQRVLLIWPEGRRLLLVHPRETSVRVPWLGAIRILSQFSQLEDVRLSDLPTANHWWHWDPWWMLRSELWTDHPVAPALRETNACHHLGSCYFDSTLQRLVSVKDDSDSVGPLRADLLPAPASSDSPARAETSFTLNPIWEHADWPMAAIRML